MQMTDSEVKVNILQAADQIAQIKICAELNATTDEEIKKILKEQGVDLRTLKGHKEKKSYEPKEHKTAFADITSIQNRIKRLTEIRENATKELNILKEQLLNLVQNIGEV